MFYSRSFSSHTKASRGSSSRFEATGVTPTSWTGFPSTERRNLSSRSPYALRTYPHRNERCATSSPTSKHRLTRLNLSNSSSALRPLRVTLVLVCLYFCSCFFCLCALLDSNSYVSHLLVQAWFLTLRRGGS